MRCASHWDLGRVENVVFINWCLSWLIFVLGEKNGMNLWVSRHQGLSLFLTSQYLCVTEVPANDIRSRTQTARFTHLVCFVKPFTSDSINVADMLILEMLSSYRHIWQFRRHVIQLLTNFNCLVERFSDASSSLRLGFLPDAWLLSSWEERLLLIVHLLMLTEDILAVLRLLWYALMLLE